MEHVGGVFGGSLLAISEAAEARGYTVVWVEKCFEVFLVRRDLICRGEDLPYGLEHFRNFTALAGEKRCGDGLEWFAGDHFDELSQKWFINFKAALSEYDAAQHK